MEPRIQYARTRDGIGITPAAWRQSHPLPVRRPHAMDGLVLQLAVIVFEIVVDVLHLVGELHETKGIAVLQSPVA